MIEAIILAAGESKRMGCLKPLLRIGEKTALAIIVEALKEAGISHTHTVVGHKSEKVIARANTDTFFVLNENYKNGQFSSLQCGISALSNDCSAAIICLVDQPHIQSTWVELLLQEYRKNHPLIVRLKFGSKTGHPILISKALFSEIINAPKTLTAKDIMTKYSNQTSFVDVYSDGILYDADTPRDFKFIQRYITKKASEDSPPDA